MYAGKQLIPGFDQGASTYPVGGAVPASAPQLAQTAERLHICVQELDGSLQALEQRLDPVLNPVNTTNKAGLAEVAPPHPVRCPVGVAMDARSDEIYALNMRVRAMLDRLAT